MWMRNVEVLCVEFVGSMLEVVPRLHLTRHMRAEVGRLN